VSSSSSAPKLGVILAAGGTGSRFGRAGGKQLAPLHGRSVVAWALDPFLGLPSLAAVVVVADPDRLGEFADQIEYLLPAGVSLQVVSGGERRQDSVAAGLVAVPAACDLVAVHDGARPLVTVELVSAALGALTTDEDAQGLVVGHPSVDTLKHVDRGIVIATPDRTLFWSIQTPQIFRAAALRRAYERAEADGFVGTDDASLVERLGGRVIAFPGSRDNIKVTHAEDLLIAEAILAAREQGA